MALKALIHPVTRQTVKMGRLRPAPPARPLMRFHDYLSTGLPNPPTQCSYAPAAAASLSQIYLNDQLGDCVVAWAAHAIGVFTGNAGGAPMLFTGAQIETVYGSWGGYVPGDSSTDNGCDEVTALNLWKQNGFVTVANKISGWLSINGADPIEVRRAIYLFENAMFGVELPDAWISPFPSASGFVWDVAGPADPQNGHCFGAAGYEPGRLSIASWGLNGFVTDAAVAEYATTPEQGELYTVLSPEIITRAQARAPNALDWDQLSADFSAMGGSLAA